MKNTSKRQKKKAKNGVIYKINGIKPLEELTRK